MNPSRGDIQAGVSLIELMVALLIGSLLVLGLVEVFAASRTAYQLSTGLARVQENGRFAMEYLQRDLRMAGHLGCVNDQARFLPQSVTASRPALVSTFLNDAEQQAAAYGAALEPLRFNEGIRGYDARIGGSGAATQSGAALTLATTPATASAANNWNPVLPTRLWADLRSGQGVPIRNSDIVVLKFFYPVGAQVTGFTPGTTATITFDNAQAQRLQEGVTNPGLFGITDCMNAAVFQASTSAAGALTVEANGANRSGLLGLQTFTVGQAMLHRAESVAYYVGLNGSQNPSLYRLRYVLLPGAAAPTAVKEELVEGIESLQLQYGLDSQLLATELPTGNIGVSEIASAVAARADPVTAWRRVGLVKVGMVARSPDPAASTQRAAGTTGLSPLGVQVTAPVPNDSRYRAVYEDSIALRNRLFGN